MVGYRILRICELRIKMNLRHTLIPGMDVHNTKTYIVFRHIPYFDLNLRKI